jgi:23S rRNA (pseudouridine1915-N3)-methyltransferase
MVPIEHVEYEIADNLWFIFQKRAPYLVFGEFQFIPVGQPLVTVERPLVPINYPPPMHLTLAHIGARASSKDGFDPLCQTYLDRCAPFARCLSEAFKGEEAMFEWLDRKQGRTKATLVLLDSRGGQMTSEAFAAWLGARRDEGAQHIVFAVGPASGWSQSAHKRAQLVLSLGPMTMAHALARLVMAEQLYRAFTILTGHPYHAGH